MELAIIFFVGMLCLGCLFLRRATLIDSLQHRGVRVTAIVTSVEQHAMFTRVTAHWRHPRTRQVYSCHSWMLSQPGSLRPGSQVRLLVDPANYQRYYMQIAY